MSYRSCPRCVNRVPGTSKAWGYQRCKRDEMTIDEAKAAASTDPRPTTISHDGKTWYRKDVVDLGECGTFDDGISPDRHRTNARATMVRIRAELRDMATMAPKVECPRGCGRHVAAKTNEGKDTRSCPHCKRRVPAQPGRPLPGGAE